MARPSSTDRTFHRKETEARVMTSESIALHVQAFESAGGRIEVLGTTRVLKKLNDAEVASSTPLPVGRGSR